MQYRVGYAACKHFNHWYGRVNWEAVSDELQISVIDCLEYFDPLQAKIFPRRCPETEEWRIEDITSLKAFTEAHFRQKMSINDWVLAGKYINIMHSDCIAKMWALITFEMTPQLYVQITEYRRAGLLWPTICHRAKCERTMDIVRVVYANTNKETIASRSRKRKTQFTISKHQHWTAAEDTMLIDLLDKYISGRDIDWNYISKTIGHSKNACRYRRILLRPRLKQNKGSAETEGGISDASATTPLQKSVLESTS
ncbi:hypothetical protein LPJ66_005021 [Kickxella alabastrina]|uniref:Uncharacterized protein n=1 Tax=Kickxella alabastrina TaxID=61397 RepID=A0ACC1II16_9FUNG|nr:hypothetical protein LPJ66_005021 [Kickxella alabastrina]